MSRVKKVRVIRGASVNEAAPLSGTMGRVGYALSVFKGRHIEKFPIEFIKLYKDGGTAGTDLIVARAGGSLISTYGGVPLGTSGSPVYIGNRLIGSISTVYPPDYSLIGITPISAMVDLEKEDDLGCRGVTVNTSAFSSILVPAASSFTSRRALDELRNWIGMEFQSASETFSRTPVDTMAKKYPMTAGSSMAVGIVDGDIKVGYIGSVTRVRNGQVLGFGHNATFAGRVELPLMSVDIIDVIRGDQPSKLGVMMETVGTVIQDRAAGVLGVLGRIPVGMASARMSVTDLDREYTENIRVRIGNIPNMLSNMVLTAAIECYTRAMNRSGAGYAHWVWKIYVQGQSDPVITEASTYDVFDISYAASVSIFAVLEPFISQAIEVTAIEMVGEVQQKKVE